jgi:hypothetical protein
MDNLLYIVLSKLFDKIFSFIFYIKYFFKKDEINKDKKEDKKENKNENLCKKISFKYPSEFFCTICINTLNEENDVFFGKMCLKFSCNHYMHFKCLYEYLIINSKRNCPLCRTKITIVDDNIKDFKLFLSYCEIQKYRNNLNF